ALNLMKVSVRSDLSPGVGDLETRSVLYDLPKSDKEMLSLANSKQRSSTTAEQLLALVPVIRLLDELREQGAYASKFHAIDEPLALAAEVAGPLVEEQARAAGFRPAQAAVFLGVEPRLLGLESPTVALE